jgi:hypothetical protein
MAESQNKKFFAERRDSFTTADRLQLPRKSVSEAVMEQFKKAASVSVEQAPLQVSHVSKPQFDSTGMFWWYVGSKLEYCKCSIFEFSTLPVYYRCPPQSFEDTVMVRHHCKSGFANSFLRCHKMTLRFQTLQHAAFREFADHILICMLATGQSPASGIHDIILPLRSSVLKYDELKEIVILGDPEVIRPEWHFICTTPKIYIVEARNI